MTKLVIDEQGRVTLSEELRERLRLKAGDAVEVTPAGEPGDEIPPWAHGDPDWRAKAEARIAAARAELPDLPKRNALSWEDFEDSVAYVRYLREYDGGRQAYLDHLWNEVHA